MSVLAVVSSLCFVSADPLEPIFVSGVRSCRRRGQRRPSSTLTSVSEESTWTQGKQRLHFLNFTKDFGGWSLKQANALLTGCRSAVFGRHSEADPHHKPASGRPLHGDVSAGGIVPLRAGTCTKTAVGLMEVLRAAAGAAARAVIIKRLVEKGKKKIPICSK